MVADRTFLVTFDFDAYCDAVVKVPPSVGCVKYKAQHIVLPTQILLFLACYKPPQSKIPGISCGIPAKPLCKRVFGDDSARFGPHSPPAAAEPSAPHSKLDASRPPLRLGPAPLPRKVQNWCIHCGYNVGKWKTGPSVLSVFSLLLCDPCDSLFLLRFTPPACNPHTNRTGTSPALRAHTPPAPAPAPPTRSRASAASTLADGS